MVKRICEQCTTEFNRSPAAIKRGEGRFCSNTCRNEYITEHPRNGEQAPKWKGGVWDRKSTSYNRTWQAKNREKSRAHWRVKEALKTGRLERKPCEQCGTSPAHAHHDDYSKPLDVRWLCQPHHAAYHASIREKQPPKPRDRSRQERKREEAKTTG